MGETQGTAAVQAQEAQYDFRRYDETVKIQHNGDGSIDIVDLRPKDNQIRETHQILLAAQRLNIAGQNHQTVEDSSYITAQDRYLADLQVVARKAFGSQLETDETFLNFKGIKDIPNDLRIALLVRGYKRVIQFHEMASANDVTIGVRSSLLREKEKAEQDLQSLLKENGLNLKDVDKVEQKYGFQAQFPADKVHAMAMIKIRQRAIQSYESEGQPIPKNLITEIKDLQQRHNITDADFDAVKSLIEFGILPTPPEPSADRMRASNTYNLGIPGQDAVIKCENGKTILVKPTTTPLSYLDDSFYFFQAQVVVKAAQNRKALPIQTLENPNRVGINKYNQEGTYFAQIQKDAAEQYKKVVDSDLGKVKKPLPCTDDAKKLLIVTSIRGYQGILDYYDSINPTRLSTDLQDKLAEQRAAVAKRIAYLQQVNGITSERIAFVEREYKLTELANLRVIAPTKPEQTSARVQLASAY